MSALLFSGGLDSTCAAILNPGHLLVRVSTGARYDSVEAARARKVAAVLRRPMQSLDKVLNLGQFEAADALIPARNAMIVLAAAQVDPFVTLVAVSGDGTHATDKDLQFADIMTSLLRKLFGKGNVALPYRETAKHHLLRAAWRADPGAVCGVLPHVYSCYGDGPDHCGACKACLRLYGAIAWCGLLELAPPFRVHPLNTPAPQVVEVFTGRGAEEQVARDVYGVDIPVGAGG